MDYMSFVAALVKGVTALQGCTEDMVHYKPAQTEPITEEDILVIFLSQTGDIHKLCRIYPQCIYQDYLNGLTIEDIVEEIEAGLHGIRNSEVLHMADILQEYEKVRELLRIRMIPVPSLGNDDVVIEQVGDIAAVLYIYLKEDAGEVMSIRVGKAVMDYWKKGKKELAETAWENMRRFAEPRIFLTAKRMFCKDYEGECFMKNEYFIGKTPYATCFSTAAKLNGAAVMFCPGVKERIAEILDESFYMAFTSCHECMVHRESCVSPDDLRIVLRETIEEATPEQDRLSYNIFHYNKETRKMTQV